MIEEQFKIESLCPVCLEKIKASVITEENTWYLVKECPEHGTFNTVLWRGGIPMNEWIRNKERAYIENPITEVEKGCPYDCGLCSEHRQHTCTALIEVTQNCNLHCKFCFADSYIDKSTDPSLEDIKLQYESVLRVSGKCNIQLSGGEPTLRDDLSEIIKLGSDLGFSFIQVNTNGIRMADDEYTRSLKEAGLSSVYLQFDGTHDIIYEKLRGKSLLEKKVNTLENCRKYGIGVVLVPTLVPGINIDNIGEIIEFGIKHSPVVRGVHFQPVSYFGRLPGGAPQDKDRITLPEVMTEICSQTNNMITADSMKPPGCENALCSFHGNYIIQENGIKQVTKRSTCCCSAEKAEEGAEKAKAFVSRNWSYADSGINDGQKQHSADWDRVLNTIQNKSFSISAMAFQDVWNVNLDRVKDCCIHVVSQDGRLIPFCIYNMTSVEGKSIYR